MKVRIGIIGCARILNAHLRGYKILQENGFGDLFQITALCARKEEDYRMFTMDYCDNTNVISPCPSSRTEDARSTD